MQSNHSLGAGSGLRCAAHRSMHGCALWLRWEEAIVAYGKAPWGDETEVLRQDAGEYMGFIRLVAAKK